MRDQKLRAAAALAVAATLAGCATAPPPPPVTAFTRSDCALSADLKAAVSLTPPKEKAAYAVVTPVGAATPCLDRDGVRAPYVVYALPAEHADKTITVGSTLEVGRLLAPDVALLGREGQVVRTFAATEYFFRGPVYSVQFRPRPEEAYVLVTADPKRVGQRYDSIAIGTSTTTVSTGYAVASWTSGVDASHSRTFSYEGAVQVSVYDSDTGKKK